MGILFLSGGGDKKHTEKFDEQFMQQLDLEKPLLYIPIAMKGIIPFHDCEIWVKSVFEPLGFTGIEMWTCLQHKTLDQLLAFSAIYIGGGNTFALVNEMRESGFGCLLKEYIEQGGIVYGGSAGAIMLGEDIRTSSHLDENLVELNEFGGMALIGGILVWCHYHPEDDGLIEKYIKEIGFPVLALSEETGAVVERGRVIVTGTSPAYLFAGDRKTKVESILEL